MSMPLLRRCWMLCLLALGVISAYGQAVAPAACPWLTQGTAARVLGGDVSVDVHVSEAGEGTCSFVRGTDAQTLLRIEVSKSTLPGCGADAKELRGIGNEALRCTLPAEGNHAVEKISGRVRDRYFTLTKRYRFTSEARGPANTQDDALEQAAESVAGNLF